MHRAGRPRRSSRTARPSRLRPGEASFHVNLGAALRKTGDIDGALTELRQATRLAPQDALALTYLELLLSEKKAYDEAHEALEKATRLDPKLAAAWTELGRMELRRKQPAALLTPWRGRAC